MADAIPEIELEYAFSIRFDISGHIEFEGSMRSRTFEPVSGGEIWGPRLQGRVVPQSGADFATAGQLNSHLMLQSTDGTWLYMNQLGYEHNDTEDGSPYFRVTPYFDSPQGSLEWISKTVFVGTGERFSNPAHLVIHYYEVL
jgi:hypothetical protein